MTSCFDVFDTVLVRTVIKPEDLHLEVVEKIREQHLCSLSDEQWIRERLEAENYIKRSIGSEHLTLEKIYQTLATKLKLTEEQHAYALTIEYDTELRNVRAVPRIKKIIDDIHASDTRVAFISDTALPAYIIQKMLELTNIWKSGDTIYTSSDKKEIKYSGGLFTTYLQETGTSPHDVIFYGNSEVSDIIPAEKLGIRTILVKDCDQTRYETAIINTSENSKRTLSYIAGASRIARMHITDLSPEERILSDVSANVAAPALFFFTLFCITEAKRLNIKRLYFVSRDGQILVKIAQLICNTHNIAIECRYLYASRHALTTALENEKTYFNTLGYLLQEGFADGVSCAIVDVGWAGHLQDSLYTILTKSGYKSVFPVSGLYFSLFRNKTPNPQNILMPYFTGETPSRLRDYLFQKFGHRALFELFVPADHGTVKTYKYVNGIFKPVFLEKSPDLVSKNGTNIVHDTILHFTSTVLSTFTPNELTKLQGREILEKTLTLLALQPTKDEAEVLGSQLFSPELQNRTYFELAPIEKPADYEQIFWEAGTSTRNSAHEIPIRKKRMLNVGCGDQYHSDWVNIDLDPADKSIKQFDILHGLPFRDSSFDVIYHSHVLEHLARKDGIKFIQECRRVLKQGGILRLAVPDLGQLATNYVNALRKAPTGTPLDTLKHQWTIMELYDQAVRTFPGGDVTQFIGTTTDPDMKEFLRQRWGRVAKILLGEEKHPYVKPPKKKSLNWQIRESILKLLLGKEYPLLETARFDLLGEKHKWMYDSHSLGTLLSSSGFGHILERSPIHSYMENWESYHLDASVDGTIKKPDSIFVEGIAV